MSEERITIVKVEGENVQRLTFCLVEHIPGKGLVRVTGDNRAGKSSLISMIRSALGGQGAVLKDPIHEGADNGWERLTLSNGFTVKRKHTENNPKGYLTVVGPDGGEHKQGLLAGWVGPLSFDPFAFFHDKTPKGDRRRQEIIFSLSTNPELPAKVEYIRTERETLREERKPWISQKRKAQGAERPEGERPVPVDVSAEMARLEELRATEQLRRDIQETARDAAEALSEAEQGHEEAKEALRKAEVTLGVAQGAHKLAVEHVENMPPDPTEEAAQVAQRIKAANEVNAALEPWRDYDKAQTDFVEADQEETRLNEELALLDETEKALFADAGIPVTGISFTDEGEPLLNGHTLDVASGYERAFMGAEIAMAADSQLGICLIDEASGIDDKGLEKLHQLGVEKGFQIWVVTLGREGPGEIVVVDGEARDREAVPDSVDDENAEAERAGVKARDLFGGVG